MKGDFSRSTFERRKHYSGVLRQQGRLRLDADWNEQADIAGHLRRTALADVIGPAGVPGEGGGFEIRVVGGEVRATAGRIYVGGVLCENEAEVSLGAQPDLPGFVVPAVPDDSFPEGWYLAYLDVWRDHITALEDGDLADLALGGPDTATRSRAVWQIKLLHLPEAVYPGCGDFPPGWRPDGGPPRPTLAARAVGSPRENRLYRVEVHRPGPMGEATFKWSRENGAFAAAIENPTEFQIFVTRQISQDEARGLAAGQWIEATDRSRLLAGLPGFFARLSSVSGQVLTVEGWPDNTPVDETPDLPREPTARRWDSERDLPVEVPATNEGFLALEGGLEIRFGDDPAAFYNTGDSWLIPTRAGAGVLWQEDAAGDPAFLPPRGVEHDYAPLALLRLDPEGWQPITRDRDCRRAFVPNRGQLDGKVDRAGDTMTGDLEILADLRVRDRFTVGPPSSGQGRLEVLEAPVTPATGTGPDRGLRFPPPVGGGEGFLHYALEGGRPKLRLGVEGGAARLALRQGGGDRLTLVNGRVGLGTGGPGESLDVAGDEALLAPENGTRIESPLFLLDGDPGAGRVYVSDADGRGRWEIPPERQIDSPVFLATPILMAAGVLHVDWTPFTIPPDKVPADAAAVIVQGEAAMNGPDDGTIDGYIRLRKSAGDADYLLLRGRASGGKDSFAWGGQGFFPIQDGGIEFFVSTPGFNGSWALWIVGYFPGGEIG